MNSYKKYKYKYTKYILVDVDKIDAKIGVIGVRIFYPEVQRK